MPDSKSIPLGSKMFSREPPHNSDSNPTVSGEFLQTLLVSDMVESTRLTEKLGDRRAFSIFSRHDRVARDLLEEHGGTEIDKTDGFLLIFERPSQALSYALAYHQALIELSTEEKISVQARVGIHLGEVFIHSNLPEDVARGAKPLEVEGLAKPIAARLMSVARGGQTLLSQGAFELARRAFKSDEPDEKDVLTWLEHGSYHLKGVNDPMRIFEVGRKGVAPLRPPANSKKVYRVSGGAAVWRGRAVIAALVVALAALLVAVAPKFFRPGVPDPTSGGNGQAATATAERQMIAVLPFESVGPAADEYFADGLSEEITSRLAAVRELGVISRNSTSKYKLSDKSLAQIAGELGVDYVLTGTVRWDAAQSDRPRVRITPRLVQISDNTDLWSDIYDHWVDDFFQVQSVIGQRVIRELGVTLLQQDREALSIKPTNNLEAYQAYLRGLDAVSRPGWLEEDVRLAIRMFERAVELDPGFAQAYAILGENHSFMFHFGFDRAEERQEMSRKAVSRSLELRPDLPEAYMAVGWNHYGHREYEEALKSYAVAAEALPNNAELASRIAYVFRRQGRFDEAVEKWKEALRLDPRSLEFTRALGESYHFMKRYAQAENSLDQAILLVPDDLTSYQWKAINRVFWKGDLEEARRVLEEDVAGRGTSSISLLAWIDFLEPDGRFFDRALERLDAIPDEIVRSYNRVYAKDLVRGHIFHARGEKALAREAYESARALLETVVAQNPDPRFHSGLGLAYAGLEMPEEALRHGKLAVDRQPIEKDALEGPYRLFELSLIQARVGDLEAALALLDQLLTIPASPISIPILKLQPEFEPLRQLPGYLELLAREG